MPRGFKIGEGAEQFVVLCNAVETAKCLRSQSSIVKSHGGRCQRSALQQEQEQEPQESRIPLGAVSATKGARTGDALSAWRAAERNSPGDKPCALVRTHG